MLPKWKPFRYAQVFVEVPDVRWEDVGGSLTSSSGWSSVEWPLQYADLFLSAAYVRPREFC